MATTANDIIVGALQLLSVYDPGEALAAQDSALGLTVLNDMLDSWSNESLSCFAISTQTGTLVPGQSAYTIGTGGNFNMTRPIRLITGPGAAYVTDSNGNRYGMEVVPENKWNMYGNVSNIVTSNFPDTLFYDPQYPLGILNVFPWPNMSYVMTWTSYLQLTDFSTLATAVSLPPGYNKTLKTCLALELWPYFLNGPVSELLVNNAAIAKGNIKRANQRPLVALYDGAIVSRAGVSYNVYTDRAGSSTNGPG